MISIKIIKIKSDEKIKVCELFKKVYSETFLGSILDFYKATQDGQIYCFLWYISLRKNCVSLHVT